MQYDRASADRSGKAVNATKDGGPMSMYSHLAAATRTPEPSSPQALTRREREVVERALSGAYNKLIAYDLGVCHSTIRVLMSRAASKLGVRTRSEVLSRFAELRFGENRLKEILPEGPPPSNSVGEPIR